MVMPAVFIPIAEETGLIVSIGNWVLRNACSQHKIWNNAGLPMVPLSINLSGRQFVDRTLSDLIPGLLAESGMQASMLELEITEGVMMHNPDLAVSTLKFLSELGIRVAVDDFGTGYSSLAYLKRFPINTLKIDRSFIRDLMEDPNDRSIVTTIIAMAHSMGLKVVAEGVETSEQLQFLETRECDIVQGYLLGRPMSLAATTDYLTNLAKLH
jgi:EAL domain-containing protein (putative c-di-GMP-specific phosphodiesterase class I)